MRNLPIKTRGAATTVQRCPECKEKVGVTSSGSVFRMRAMKPRAIETSAGLLSAMVCVGPLLFVGLLVASAVWLAEQAPPPASVVPPAAIPVVTPQPIGPHELAQVPEVGLPPLSGRKEDAALLAQRQAQIFAKAKELNAAKQDGFLLAQIDKQPELRGLPFMMGDACRLKPLHAEAFRISTRAVRDAMDRDVMHFSQAHDGQVDFWDTYSSADRQGFNSESGLAALAQILGPESKEVRVGLMTRLAGSTHRRTIPVLTRAAIFDAVPEVRLAALEALKEQSRSSDSAEILMYGMRYPMADVAKRSAQAIIALDRQDLVPQLVSLLAEAAPGDPVEAVVDEKKVCTVREVVRINHHRNCLLCHAPVQKGSRKKSPRWHRRRGRRSPLRRANIMASGTSNRARPCVRTRRTCGKTSRG